MSVTNNLICSAVALAGLTLLGDAAAQTGGPPILRLPSDNYALFMRGNVATTPVFSWQPPSLFAGKAPQSYQLCIVEQGSTCGSPGALVIDVGAATQHQVQLPQTLLEKVLSWSAAACGSGFGGKAALPGMRSDCSWAAFRTFDTRTAVIGAASGSGSAPLDGGLRSSVTRPLTGGRAPSGGLPPRLASPSSFDAIRMHASSATPITFVWQPPLSTAESAAGMPPPQRYRLCIRELSASCDSPSALVHDVGQATFYNAHLPASFYGKRIAWTAAACGPEYGSGGAGPNADCTWAQSITLQTVSSSGAPFGN